MHVLCMVRFRHEKHSGFALTYSGLGGFCTSWVSPAVAFKITTKTFVGSLKSRHRFHKSVPHGDFRLLTCILSLRSRIYVEDYDGYKTFCHCHNLATKECLLKPSTRPSVICPWLSPEWYHLSSRLCNHCSPSITVAFLWYSALCWCCTLMQCDTFLLFGSSIKAPPRPWSR